MFKPVQAFITHTLSDYAYEDIIILNPKDVRLQLRHDNKLGLIGIYRDAHKHYQEVLVNAEDGNQYACVVQIHTEFNMFYHWDNKLMLLDKRCVDFLHYNEPLCETNALAFWNFLRTGCKEPGKFAMDYHTDDRLGIVGVKDS